MHADKEDKVLEQGPFAATPLSPSAIRITVTSAATAWIFDARFASIFSLVAVLKSLR